MSIPDFIRQALAEDIGDGDHTSLSTIPADKQGKALVRVKQDGIIAGLVLADQILNTVDPTVIVKVLSNEGQSVSNGTVVMEVEGAVRSLLMAERLLLNCMQRMSGIATMTRQFVEAVAGTGAIILDTRKTTPNFRLFEKWAVLLGGGQNHRFGLFDMILIKDNHVDAAGGIRPAIRRANDYLRSTGRQLPIEIETRNAAEVEEVLAEGNVQRIMLDNFTTTDLQAAVARIAGRFETEASGGINLQTVRGFAETGVQFISVGALTHSYRSLDISMKILR
ncbi:MAG: carboxylating nicotinate-nucleotide diphosphorylase [Bacteroidia bacterium]|nr:carboxylating nicotinate-nucleotide diphosphorylase [Bacteroidia bacterium]MBP6010103.1 carboxylating nicotinate-nucleotide diphosphorylase [Bacteroidia bacterium]MBP7269280.1 carboxylating nicotinate-nucleotide diphosphorylase [Bacteroidia bacterium]MBP7437432.1 carboxylating nicotinate-nucleotide diphosphorylase [Bacteroidia bacterium]MBP7771959.1 carboxylating nicotinate-nucleotide diphosphorylase [Bacteroidia bacterium]